jgi:hypothetical protein
MIALGHFEGEGNFDAESPEIHAALTAARVFRDRSKDFVNLSLYEQRLSRQQKEAMKQLRELHAERKAAPPQDIRLSAASASVPTEMRLPAPLVATAGTSGDRIGIVYSTGSAVLFPQLSDEKSGALDTEYDPCACQSPFMEDTAFDPIYFKNSIPVQFIEIPVAATEKKAA